MGKYTGDITAFLEQARERYEAARRADEADRADGEADNRFANATDSDKAQWPKEQYELRKSSNRPIIQWNRIPTFLQQIQNAGRQSKPSIKIAVGEGGRKEVAEFFQVRIREIEYASDADIAYDTARDHQSTSGRGFIRIKTEYVEGSFRQRVCIDRIENQFSVYFDPASRKYDCSDAEWCFVVSRLSKDQYDRRYGKKSRMAHIDFSSPDNPCPEWLGLGKDGDLIQVAEYWCKHFRRRTLLLLGNGKTAWKDELAPKEYEIHRRQGLIIAEREEQYADVWQYVINGAEILTEEDWLGTSIPIVPVWGREVVVDGRRRHYSLIRQAKEPQIVLNFEVSNLVEQLAQVPKTPWLVSEESVPPHLIGLWQAINREPLAYLPYKRFSEDGRDLGVPVRNVWEPPIQALVIAINQAIDAIKASMGIYDAALGARSNETSGIAIKRRQSESDVANFHFPDNEARSRKRVGEILIELIPKIDQAGMEVPVRSEDGKTKVVPIGVPHVNEKGQEIVLDLMDGQYGVAVETGPTYTSALAEGNERMGGLIQANNELMWVFGDVYLRSSGIPGSDMLAERMGKAIQLRTPGLVEPSPDEPQLPPAAQAQIARLQQDLEKAVTLAADATAKLESKEPELEHQERMKRLELDFKREELDAKIKLELAKLGDAQSIAELNADTQRIDAERKIAATRELEDSRREAEKERMETERAMAAEAEPEPVGVQ